MPFYMSENKGPILEAGGVLTLIRVMSLPTSLSQAECVRAIASLVIDGEPKPFYTGL